jgi:hypothetical protein
MPPGPITGPSAWRGEDLARSEDWIHRLSDADIAEIDAALASARDRGLGLMDIDRAAFPLPRLGKALDAIHRELLAGRGFVLIRGLPMDRYSTEEAAMAYWGIGRYLGNPVSQNAKGHLLGHVRDLGYDVNDPNVRVYQTTERQCYHADSCDFVALLCLRGARRGGHSSLVSSVTLHNEILARRPDLLPVLFEPFRVDRRGEVPEGMKPYFEMPVFTWHDGLLSGYYVRRYIESAQRFPDVPKLTARQIEALDLLDALADDPALHHEMEFEPGDMQVLHNHQILHDRTAFEDWAEPDRKRHLLRLWLCPPDGRPLPDCFRARWGSIEIGQRGGILAPETELNAPLEPV